jgi:hypothetical protein
MSPWPLVSIAAILAAALYSRPILAHIAFALSVSLVAVLVFVPMLLMDSVSSAAQAEGCVGPYYLRHVVAGLILLGAIAVFARSWRKTEVKGD